MEKLFEKGTRLKVRFALRGQLTIEDLWSLSMDDLNTIAKKLNKDLKESSEESFITVKSKEDAIVELKFEIVKYIIKVRLEEQAKRKTVQERAQKRALLKELMDRKALTELESKSMADLQAEIDALDALED